MGEQFEVFTIKYLVGNGDMVLRIQNVGMYRCFALKKLIRSSSAHNGWPRLSALALKY